MKKKKGLLVLLALPLALVMLFCCVALCWSCYIAVCRNINAERNPLSQPGSRWESEDGTMIIQNKRGSGDCYLYLTQGENQLKLKVSTDSGNYEMFLFTTSENDSGKTHKEYYETWRTSYKSKKKFVATVQETTYFKVGQKITFHRVYPK